LAANIVLLLKNNQTIYFNVVIVIFVGW
jgi:hypothetical protein